jgi:hypothetical protein
VVAGYVIWVKCYREDDGDENTITTNGNEDNTNEIRAATNNAMTNESSMLGNGDVEIPAATAPPVEGIAVMVHDRPSPGDDGMGASVVGIAEALHPPVAPPAVSSTAPPPAENTDMEAKIY